MGSVDTEIYAQGVISPEESDNLYVCWSLLHTCNYNCSYCFRGRDNGKTVFMKERLLTMAYRILEFPAPYYDIIFTGGEPTLHPFLIDLTHYFLRSPRKTGVTIETNATMPLDWFGTLLGNIPEYSLQVEISVHPAFANLEKILKTIALINSEHQAVNVKLMLDPANWQKTETFQKTLLALRQTLAFNLVLTPLTQPTNISLLDSRYNNNFIDWLRSAKEALDKAVASGPEMKPLLPRVEPRFYGKKAAQDITLPMLAVKPNNSYAGFTCCIGANVLHINPDGSFYSALCKNGSNKGPLWQAAPHSILNLGRVVQCEEKQCQIERNGRLPKFINSEQARQWLADREERQARYIWDSNPLPDPLSLEPAVEKNILFKLKRLKPLRASQPGQAHYKAVLERLPDIGKIYSLLANQESQELFLRDIKSYATGDLSYLPLFTEDKKPVDNAEIPVIKLEAGEDAAKSLRDVIKNISAYQPELIVSAQNPLLLLDAIIWLREFFPEYTLLLQQHDCSFGGIYLQGIPPRKQAIAIARPTGACEASIIVYCQGHEEHLQRCLDSILIQTVKNIEIIIIANEPDNDTQAIINNYTLCYPRLVRCLNLSQEYGAACNAAMDQAISSCVAFMSANDYLAPDFIEKGLNIIKAENADIVALDLVVLDGENRKLWAVEPGAWSDWDGLKQFLLNKTGAYAACGRLYKRSLIRAHNIRFGAGSNADLYFTIPAFYFASKVFVSADRGYYRTLANDKAADTLENVFNLFTFLNRFFALNDLSKDNEAYRFCVRQLYSQERNSIFNSIANAVDEGNLKQLLNHDLLLEFANCKDLLLCVLSDFLLLYCERSGLGVKSQADLLSQKADLPEPVCAPYENADADSPLPQRISVLMVNYNKAPEMEKCLAAILGQSMREFELIIIDNGSTDGGYELLQSYADMYPNIRLYRLDYHIAKGLAQNMAIAKARGKYCLFVNSGDICLPGYFAAGARVMDESGADMALFSSEIVDQDGNKIYINELKDAVLNNADALIAFTDEKFTPTPWAKVYNLDFINKHKCRFAKYSCCQEASFFPRKSILPNDFQNMTFV